MGTTNRTHERPAGLNLLRFSAVRKLIEWRGFPRVFQFATLAVFLVLVWIGFQLYPPPETNGKLFAKCNVVTLLIWGVWWPSMIYLAVLFGRSWCMVCPLELVASVTERMGQKLGWPQRNLSRWLASGALIVFLYFVIQMLVAGIHLHRVPAYTAIFLLTLLGTAAAVGFLFKNRAFCRGFCPVGVLLGTYGRGSMLAVRARSDESSEVCTGKQSCPSLLNPPKLNSSRDCLICGQCVKSCEPDTMQLLLRPRRSDGGHSM